MAFPRLLGHVLLDFLCLILVLIPMPLILIYTRPYQRGFFCDDQSIRYPYKGDTVSGLALLCGGFFFPIQMFALVEAVYFFVKRRSPLAKSILTYEITKSCSIPVCLSNFYKVFGIFFFGEAVQLTMTFVGKYSIGRLRPNFIAVCQPDTSLFNCTPTAYIEDNVCTRQLDAKLIDARQSFPSGHSSIAAYAAVFLVIYLQTRLVWKWSTLLRPCIHAALVVGAMFICLSRVMDNRHHWSDIFAGAAIGIFVGIVAGFYTAKQLRASERNEKLELPHHVTKSAVESQGDTQL